MDFACWNLPQTVDFCMARFREKLDNLLEYFGIRSKNYYHSGAQICYDPNDPLAYYLDPSPRANYPGPFDSRGIPLYISRGTTDYLPVLICTYALGHSEIFRQNRTEENLSKFLEVARWLVSHQNSQGAWLTNFPMKKFGLFKPFPCAMVQGLGISCLARAFLVINDEMFLESAVRALAPYGKEVREGGVASYSGPRVFYEEFPSVPYHHVLNGFIFAIWGLLDLVRVAGNRDAETLYNEGLKTLIEWVPRYDLGYWSLYHIGDGPKNPATVPYHRLHIRQLRVMHTLTDHEVFVEYHLRWSEYLHNRLNALKTLPAKILWSLARAPSAQ